MTAVEAFITASSVVDCRSSQGSGDWVMPSRKKSVLAAAIPSSNGVHRYQTDITEMRRLRLTTTMPTTVTTMAAPTRYSSVWKMSGGSRPETASAKPVAMYMPCSQLPKRWPCSRDSISPHMRAAQAQGKAIWAICSRPMPTTLEAELPSQNWM